MNFFQYGIVAITEGAPMYNRALDSNRGCAEPTPKCDAGNVVQKDVTAGKLSSALNDSGIGPAREEKQQTLCILGDWSMSLYMSLYVHRCISQYCITISLCIYIPRNLVDLNGGPWHPHPHLLSVLRFGDFIALGCDDLH